jgi:predicted transporter
MLIVILAFAVVFLFRDAQALMTEDRQALGFRLAGYAAIVLTAVAIASNFGQARPAILYSWAERRFALGAISIQLAEVGIFLALRKWADERHQWIGCVLPCPAFLVALFVSSYIVRNAVAALNLLAATELVTGAWLALVAVSAFTLSRIESGRVEEGSANKKFVDDFALMTSCTALIFVPYGLF